MEGDNQGTASGTVQRVVDRPEESKVGQLCEPFPACLEVSTFFSGFFELKP